MHHTFSTFTFSPRLTLFFLWSRGDGAPREYNAITTTTTMKKASIETRGPHNWCDEGASTCWDSWRFEAAVSLLTVAAPLCGGLWIVAGHDENTLRRSYDKIRTWIEHELASFPGAPLPDHTLSPPPHSHGTVFGNHDDWHITDFDARGALRCCRADEKITNCRPSLTQHNNSPPGVRQLWMGC